MEQPRRLMADAMLGKLAKWLRILGFDVAYERAIEDQTLVRRAKLENRDILTCDRRLAQRRWGGSLRIIIIKEDHLPGQLGQVIREFGLPIRTQMLSRCIRCNEPLISFPRDKAFAYVPRYVYRTQKLFFKCPSCRRLYWQGTHPKRILNSLRTFIFQLRSKQRMNGNIK